jgi:hypothetical protein
MPRSSASGWWASDDARPIYARIAHLLCEIGLRLQAVGLGQDDNFKLPMTQAELADALGLTTVHVNRTLKQLRREGLITLLGRTLTLSDPEGLARAGQFDPGYLSIGRRNDSAPHLGPHRRQQEPKTLRLEL